MKQSVLEKFSQLDVDKFNEGISLIIESTDFESRVRSAVALLNSDEKRLSPNQVVWFKTQGRRTGNTTRMIDAAIQIIFHGKACIVGGVHDEEHGGINADKFLFKKILERISREHPGASVLVDKSSLMIWLDHSYIIRPDQLPFFK